MGIGGLHTVAPRQICIPSFFGTHILFLLSRSTFTKPNLSKEDNSWHHYISYRDLENGQRARYVYHKNPITNASRSLILGHINHNANLEDQITITSHRHSSAF